MIAHVTINNKNYIKVHAQKLNEKDNGFYVTSRETETETLLIPQEEFIQMVNYANAILENRKDK